MRRSVAVCLLGVLGVCASQGVGDSVTASTASSICGGSTADYCVRTCCPEGQNAIARECTESPLRWTPSFLSGDVSLKVVGGPMRECGPNEDQVTFTTFSEPRAAFELQPSGELTVTTDSDVYHLGHDYCFRNIEHDGQIFETLRCCVPKVVPQVAGLVSIDNVTRVAFRKCCPVGQLLVVNRETQDFDCANSSVSWLPEVLHGDPTSLVPLPPEKAEIRAEGDFRCPQNAVPQYLHSDHNKFFLEANGHLLVDLYNVTLNPDRFCLDVLQSPSPKPQVIGHVCYDETERHTEEQFEELCPSESVCTRKCCAANFLLSNTYCIPATTSQWRPTFHQEELVVPEPDNFTLLYGRSECEGGHNFIFSRRVGEKDVPFLQVNGDIQVPRLNLTFKAHQCCIDSEVFYDKSTKENHVVETAICCQPEDLEASIREYVNSTLLTISFICLFIMLAIYMLVPKLRNVHGKCLMSHAAALFVAFFLTVFNQLHGVELGPGCDALGLMLYYSFIAALFWLNVMSFDIWWTFAHLRTQSPSQRSLRNRFIRHSLYAWGVPLLMTCLLAFFNYVPYDVIPKGAILRPDLGERKCFLSGKDQELYYFYVPIFIVTGVNILFFVATAYTLYQAEKSSRILNRKRTARDRLKVYVNLFIIMEVSWIAECLSTQIGPIQAWYFTDIINASQGLLIFLLFIGRSSTRQTIRERFVELGRRGLIDSVTRRIRHADKNDEAARTSMPTKTTNTNTTVSSSATARKGSDNEAYQMTEKGGTDRPKGGDEQELTTDGPDPAPADCAC
ncbi:probable G-protein coupled receptor Mth-like 1 isoform X2 [Amphibalanus amphitrite]|uniref:probable G-protein coupled receptor Mth-like 1 isoform X2 n=1 Tax=Amphibalanus amphitrite TaxID=1232801 RepID=UPI001C923AFD|nr:probable G-protein coupled receptor Mth-like 1 isoform X2 [Amphibalanus amphitrite]